MFPSELRASLRRELGPDVARRERVRHALSSSVAAGTLSPAAQRVDALLQAQAASALGTKAAVTATVHSLTAKLVVVGVLVAGGTSAVVMRGSLGREPAAIEAPKLGAAQRTSAEPPAGPENAKPQVANDSLQPSAVDHAVEANARPAAVESPPAQAARAQGTARAASDASQKVAPPSAAEGGKGSRLSAAVRGGRG